MNVQELFSRVQAKLKTLESRLPVSESQGEQNEVETSGASVLTDIEKLIDNYAARIDATKAFMQPEDLTEKTLTDRSPTSIDKNINEESIPTNLTVGKCTVSIGINKSPSKQSAQQVDLTNATLDNSTFGSNTTASNNTSEVSTSSVNLTNTYLNDKPSCIIEQSRSTSTPSAQPMDTSLIDKHQAITKPIQNMKPSQPMDMTNTSVNKSAIITEPSQSLRATQPVDLTDTVQNNFDNNDAFSDLFGEFENVEELYGIFDDVVESELSSQTPEETDGVRTVAELAEDVNTTNHFDPRVLGIHIK